MVHCHPGKTFFLVLVFTLLFLGCSLKRSPLTGEEFPRETIRLEKLIQESADPSARAKLHRQLADLYIHHQNPGRNYGRALQEFETYLSLAPVEARTDEDQNWVWALREMEREKKEAVQCTGKMEDLAGENREKRETLERQEKMLDLERKKNEEWQALGRKKDEEWQARLGEMQGRLEEMEKANQDLKEANRSLRESTERMKRTLEKLKNLDLQMEEKRKTIK
jgi:hypothetical protein